jgi:hypothetical protein|tara:strand:+ start:212 stop:757 length:546 start_codon:yes stop_codon:yes gene_type:complete
MIDKTRAIINDFPDSMDKLFWKVYPEAKLIPEFHAIWKEDRGQIKTKSSKLMWALILVLHKSSMFVNVSDPYAEVATAYLKDPKFKWDKYQNAIDKMKDCILTPAEKSLTLWEETVKMRDRFLKKLYIEILESEDLLQIEKADKILSNTPKMFDDLIKIKATLNVESVTKKNINMGEDNDF